MSPILIHTRSFPFGDYRAITLFPFVLYKGEPLTPTEVRHETVHLWQQAALLVLPFYLLYLVFWIIGMARHRNSFRAYRDIPFERSAYDLESHTSASRSSMAFGWMSVNHRQAKNDKNNNADTINAEKRR